MNTRNNNLEENSVVSAEVTKVRFNMIELKTRDGHLIHVQGTEASNGGDIPVSLLATEGDNLKVRIIKKIPSEGYYLATRKNLHNE